MNSYEYTTSIHEKILTGRNKGFSPYFFQPAQRKDRIVTLVRYLVEEKLGLTPEEALERVTIETLKTYRLTGILRYIDRPDEAEKDEVRHVIHFAYPELPQPSLQELAVTVYKEVLEGKRKSFPKNYFAKNGPIGEERAIVCFRYLCEDELGLSKEEVVEVFVKGNGLKVLADYKLKIIMNMIFFSIIDLLSCAYPGEFDFAR